MSARLVAVKCKLYPGIFPSERQFEVTLANGEPYLGIAPRHFCWTVLGKIVEENEPTEGVDGILAAKRIANNYDLPQGIVAIEVPDGEVLGVQEHNILSRPTKINPPGVEVS